MKSTTNIKIKVGEKYGRLTVIEITEKRSWGSVIVKCRCDCGEERLINAHSLKRGLTKSCGCLKRETTKAMEPHHAPMLGKRFGRLLVIEKTSERRANKKSVAVVYKCLCDCGNECLVPQYQLANKSTKSCGCLAHEVAKAVAEKTFSKARDENMIQGTNIFMLKNNTANKNSKTGVRGVCYNETMQKYRAYIGFKGTRYELGFFGTLEEATKARTDAKEKLHNEFLKNLEKTNK